MSARPYVVTWKWHNGETGRASYSTRKAAEVAKAETLAVAEGLRDGSWLIAMSGGKPIPAKEGEVLEYDAERGIWIKKVPAAKVTVRITKRGVR